MLLRASASLSLVAFLSSCALADDDYVGKVVKAGWENIGFLSAPFIAWIVATAIYGAKIDQGVSPTSAAHSSIWWLLGVFALICSFVFLLILAFTVSWWMWLILLGVPILFFIVGYAKGRRSRGS